MLMRIIINKHWSLNVVNCITLLLVSSSIGKGMKGGGA
jgi:hypothetical protein